MKKPAIQNGHTRKNFISTDERARAKRQMSLGYK